MLLLLMATVRRVSGDGAALASGVALVGSTFFLVQAASWYSHVGSLFLLAGATLHGARSLDGGWKYAAMGGLLAGLSASVRPLDAALFSVAFVLAVGPRDPRAAAAWSVGFLPGAALFVGYNRAQFGGWFTTGYDAYLPTFVRLYGPSHQGADFSLANTQHVWDHFTWLLQLNAWVLPGLLLLFPIGLAALGRTRPRLALWMGLTVGLYAVAIQFTTPLSNNTYGPRYLFALLLPLCVAAGPGWQALREHVPIRRGLAAAAICSLLASGMYGVWKVGQLDGKIAARRDILQRVEAAVGDDALVFLGKLPGYPASWYARNTPDFGGPIVYAASRGLLEDQAVHAVLRDRRPWLVWVDEEGELQIEAITR